MAHILRKKAVIFTVVLLSVLMALPAASFGAQSLSVTSQPEDVTVNYPDGASFHVEVNDPSLVASYQWELTDQHSLFVLSGESAKTDTLIVPATQQDDPVLYIRCLITGTDGTELYTDYATLTVANPEEDKTVLYIGEYALEPGETLDIGQTPYGSGTAEFREDGVTVVLTDAVIDNTKVTYDYHVGASLGMYLVRRHPVDMDYTFDFKGDCEIINTCYDEEYNASGVAINSFFACGDDEVKPTIHFTGEGSLSVTGGTTVIYSDGNISIERQLSVKPCYEYFSDGIACTNLYINDAELEIDSVGTTIRTKENLTIENSVLRLTSTAPHVSVGSTAKNVVYVFGSINAKDSEIHITGRAEEKNFAPYGSYLMAYCGIVMNGDGSIRFDNCGVEMLMEAESTAEPFAININGIFGAGDTTSLELVNGSTVSVIMTDPGVQGVSGIVVPGDVIVRESSSLSVEVQASGEVIGLDAEGKLDVNESGVSVKVYSDTGEATYGIVGGGTDLVLTDPRYVVSSYADGGIAIAASTGEVTEEEVVTPDDYATAFINISEKAVILSPEGGKIGVTEVPAYGETIIAETVIDPASGAPASVVDIGVPASSKSGTWIYIALAAVVVLAAVFLLTRRKTSEKE